MRLLFVTRRMAPDTRSVPARVFASLYREARLRHEVRLVAGYKRARELVPAEALGIDLCGVSDIKARSKVRRAARREVRRFKPDVVLVNDLSAPLTGRPTVCLVHDLSFDAPRPTLRTRLLGQAAAARGASFDRIVVPSVALARELERLGVDARRVVHIPHGVDTEAFRPAAIDSERDVLTLLCPGRVQPAGGQHVAIDAVARLTPVEKARVHLRILGPAIDPVYYEQLEVQAWRQPVSFHPETSDPTPEYRAADLIVYTSLLHLGFADPVTWGLACETPVVWADHPALREAMGSFGYPVPAGDVEALRARIRRFLDEPERHRASQRGARDRVLEHLDARRSWRSLEQVLLETAAS